MSIAVIFGAGPGTGAAIARALSPTHSLVLLSRSLPGTLPKLNLNLPADRVLGCTFDEASPAASFRAALDAAQAKWPKGKVDVGIVHAGIPFAPGDFLERTGKEMRVNMECAAQAFDFAHAVIPHMLPHGGTLLFTGATMSIKGGAKFSAMSPGSFARRALSQSLAREFGPKGIHVCHIIVDGLIATANVEGMLGKAAEGSRLVPEDIAQVYLDVIRQKKSAWTQEMDIRPSLENF